MVFHNGNDSEQLLVGQWRSSIVVMNGNDYANKQKTPKLYIKEGLPSHKTRYLTITTGLDGTCVYLEGQLVRKRRNLLLKIPTGTVETTLVLGNSVNGRHPWKGEFYGFVLFPFQLNAKDIVIHHDEWMKSNSFSSFKKYSPSIMYMFDENSGHKALDHSSGGHHLNLPAQFRILQKEILGIPQRTDLTTKSSIQDILLNLLGFIPFAIALNAVFLHANRWTAKHGALLTLLLCFTISLSIELIQAEMPSRSSQLIDLILNTLGSGLGLVVFGHWYSKITTNNERRRRDI